MANHLSSAELCSSSVTFELLCSLTAKRMSIYCRRLRDLREKQHSVTQTAGVWPRSLISTGRRYSSRALSGRWTPHRNYWTHSPATPRRSRSVQSPPSLDKNGRYLHLHHNDLWLQLYVCVHTDAGRQICVTHPVSAGQSFVLWYLWPLEHLWREWPLSDLLRYVWEWTVPVLPCGSFFFSNSSLC